MLVQYKRNKKTLYYNPETLPSAGRPEPIRRANVPSSPVRAVPMQLTALSAMARRAIAWERIYGGSKKKGVWKGDDGPMKVVLSNRQHPEYGAFNHRGYVSYHGVVSMEKLLAGAPCQRMDFSMGGMEMQG